MKRNARFKYFFLIILLSIYTCIRSDTTEVCLTNSQGERECNEPTDQGALDHEIDSDNNEEIEEKKEEIVIPKGANSEGRPIDVSFDDCKDRYEENCREWSSYGECERNPGKITYYLM